MCLSNGHQPGRASAPPPLPSRRARAAADYRPCRHPPGTGRRLGKTLCPPTWKARADGNYHPLQALREHRPPPGQDSPSPQAAVPGPFGAAVPCKPSWSTDHRLGRTPRPPKLPCPGRSELLSPASPPGAPTTAWAGLPVPPGWCARAVGSCCPLQALLEHRPPPWQDSPPPQAGAPGPLGPAAPRRPSLSTDHRLGRTPRPPRLVCPGCWELLSPASPP